MAKRETDAVARILSDPENQTRSAEEVAELAIEELDAVRARTHRLAVVGQIRFTQAQERPHTVVLGPFSARGVLDSQEKFLAAVQGGTAARDAGEHLAWDPKTRVGSGRFMLAPIFKSPRDAWEFYRQAPAEEADGIGEIAQQLRVLHEGPTCACGLKGSYGCHRHPAA